MSLKFLTATEVAEMLRVNLETVYSLTSKEGLPGAKIGGQWRFNEDEISKWILSRHSHSKLNPNEDKQKINSPSEKLDNLPIEKNHSLLIVDASKSDQKRYKKILGDNYTCKDVKSGEETITQLQVQIPSCIILHLKPTATNNNRILQAIKDLGLLELSPIIVVTGKGAEEIAVQCMRIGISDYLSKENIKAGALNNAIQHAIGNFQSKNKLAEKQNALQINAKKASEDSMAKSEFIARLSRDIRTPLNGIINFLDLFLQSAPPSNKPDYVEIAKNSAEYLNTLIGDVIDYTKIESGRLELINKPFNFRQTIKASVDVCVPLAFQKSIDLVLSLSEQIPVLLEGDALRFQQTLVNLLINKIEASQDKSKITVHVNQRESSNGSYLVEFCLCDGQAIPTSNHQNVIFESFKENDMGIFQKYISDSLSLILTNRIINLLGGELWLEQFATGQTNIHFTTRFKQAESILTTGKSSTSMPISSEGSLKILVAEDNVVCRKLMQSLLTNWGHQVVLAQNGKEALNLSANHRFDLIIMDIQMPIMNGIEATRQLRSRELSSKEHIPVIALTADVTQEARNLCMQNGMDAYVLKPIVSNQFRETIQNIISKDSSKKLTFINHSEG